MKKPHKMDRHLIAADQPHELDTAVQKMKKEGFTTSREEVRQLAKQFNNSRRKIYKAIREKNVHHEIN